MWLIYALLTACLWGTGQLFLKKGYAKISPLWTAVIDLPIYLLIFVPFSLVKGASFDINPEDLILIFIVATLTVAYYYGLAKGQLAVSGTLIAAYPIVTVVASIMFLGEYISPLQILAVGSVIVGTVLISLNDKFRLGKNKSLIIWPIATAFILGISDFVAKIALNGVERHSPVILDKPGDEALLGVMTLEILGLVLDPFKRELRPMKLRLG